MVPLLFCQHAAPLHADGQAFLEAAKLTIFPRFLRDFARAGAPANIVVRRFVLDRSAEKGPGAWRDILVFILCFFNTYNFNILDLLCIFMPNFVSF